MSGERTAIDPSDAGMKGDRIRGEHPSGPAAAPDDGLIFAWAFDGHGGGRRLTSEDLADLTTLDQPVWVHLDRTKTDSTTWLEHGAGIPRDIRDSLLAEDARPRCEAMHDGQLINLRGVNLNPNAEPDDLPALRLWARKGLIITLRRHRIMAAEDMSDRLTERMQPTIANLDLAVDRLEDQAAARKLEAGLLPGLRQTAVTLRRFFTPQQIALSRLASMPTSLLGEENRIDIRHTLDVVTRVVEDLDQLRERTTIIDDLLRQQQADQMARATYLLSLVATLFLPLGFLTGLLGINVGGIPGVDVA